MGWQTHPLLAIQTPRPVPILQLRNLRKRELPGSTGFREALRRGQTLVRDEVFGHPQHETLSRRHADRGRPGFMEIPPEQAGGGTVRWVQTRRIRGFSRECAVQNDVRRFGKAGIVVVGQFINNSAIYWRTNKRN
mmetsp:Transcript_30777/g.43692  ORF Transcript_30777/g.43692 Transcript_30777/m.43692 type:complete len:135 (+) Transcript_30777:527-931(+)